MPKVSKKTSTLAANMVFTGVLVGFLEVISKMVNWRSNPSWE
jgi:hypothetical protein